MIIVIHVATNVAAELLVSSDGLKLSLFLEIVKLPSGDRYWIKKLLLNGLHD